MEDSEVFSVSGGRDVHRWVKCVKGLWPQAGARLEERGAVSGNCGCALILPHTRQAVVPRRLPGQ